MFEDYSQSSRESHRIKNITFMMNGRPDRAFTLQVLKKPLNKQQIFRAVQKNWSDDFISSSSALSSPNKQPTTRQSLVRSMGLPDISKDFENGNFSLKSMRIFSIDAVEYFNEDLNYLKNGDRLYISNGQEFNSNKNFGEYQIISKLGEGGFGNVDLAKNMVTSELAAIKVLKTGNSASGTQIDMLFKEAQNLKALNHPNIVKILNCYALNDMRLVIVMEYLEGGELLQLLKKQKKLRFEQNEAKELFKQIINGVSYCHKMGLIHRDLKLENILLTSTRSQTCFPNSKKVSTLKIADFGISGVADHFNPDADWGTLRYMPPQILSKKTRINSPAVDVWACGVILFLLTTGKFPFDGNSSFFIMQAIVNNTLSFPPNILLTVKCKKLIQRMLQKDPFRRISMQEIEENAWINTNASVMRTPEDVDYNSSQNPLKTISFLDFPNLSMQLIDGSYFGNQLNQYDLEDLKNLNALNKRKSISKVLSLKQKERGYRSKESDKKIAFDLRRSFNMHFGSPNGSLNKVPKRLEKQKNQIIEQLRFHRYADHGINKQKMSREGSQEREHLIIEKSAKKQRNILPKIYQRNSKRPVGINEHNNGKQKWVNVQY